MDQDARSKLNAFGTYYWNIIQKHPALFLDTYPEKICSRDSSAKKNGTTSDESAELQACRAIASAFLRALACRLILISKFHTKGHDVPQLIMSVVPTETGQLVSHDSSTPLALMSELEFGLKVFTRAGKALALHSPDEYSSEAYEILSLATVCWSGIRMSNVAADEDYMFVEAFDALLLLPDCAVRLSQKETNKAAQSESPKEQDNRREIGGISSKRVMQHLQSLEEFVNTHIDLVADERQNGKLSSKAKASLLVNQHYLPSLARICYKVSSTISFTITV
jgi:hypothetical protein